MVTESVAGTLNDLTPEQMAIFDAAVEGRWQVTMGYLLDTNIVTAILKHNRQVLEKLRNLGILGDTLSL